MFTMNYDYKWGIIWGLDDGISDFFRHISTNYKNL